MWLHCGLTHLSLLNYQQFQPADAFAEVHAAFNAAWDLAVVMPFLRLAMPAYRYRTGKLLFTLAQRLSKHTRRLGAFEAWNKCLSHILALARAYVESVMFERFMDGVNACPDADCRKSLKACPAPSIVASSGNVGSHWS